MNIKNVFSPLLNLFKKNNSSVSQNIFKKDTNGLNLRNIIKNSYKPQDSLNGYTLDKELSGKRQQVYIDKDNKKMLMSVAGTRSGTDVLNDFRLIGGGIKNTARYQSADNTLKSAKEKYGDYENLLIGHSLGGSIASRLGGDNDRRITYNAGEVGGKQRKNTTAVRHSGDPISLIGAGKSHNFGNPLTILNPLNWVGSHSSNRLND